MTNKFWKLTTLTTAGLLIGAVAWHRVPSAVADNEPVAYDACGDQGHMEAALEHLRAARHELHEASPNKGGHRDAAMARTQEAINQVKAGCHFADDRRDGE